MLIFDIETGMGAGTPTEVSKIKTLSFVIQTEVKSISPGPGPLIILPDGVDPENKVLHILLHDKPEICLSLDSLAARTALIQALSQQIEISQRSSRSGGDLPRADAHKRDNSAGGSVTSPRNSSPRHGTSDEMSARLKEFVNINCFFWAEKVGARKELLIKLIVLLSDHKMQVYGVPAEYDPTRKSDSAASMQTQLGEKLRRMTEAPWSCSFLASKGFELEASADFDNISICIEFNYCCTLLSIYRLN
jgi:hypothetical protein